MKIFNPSGVEILDIEVDDSSYRYRSIMSDDSLMLKYSLTAPLSVPVGSWCEFQGARYMLYYPENFKKHHSRNFEYTLVLHSWRESLKLYLYKDTSAKPYRVKFPLTATPDAFLQLIIDVMNLHDTDWVKGDVILADEKLISFNHESCYDALTRIAQEFDTEWEVINKTIHLRRVEKFKETPLAMSYGKGKGFVSGVGRANNGDRQPIGRMYVAGGERNIDFSKYGSRSLLLPKSATLLYEGKTYRTDADGMYVTRDGNHNRAEGSYDGSQFYPKRVGAVTAVEVVDLEQHFYDIIDANIPESLDYSQCRIAGEKATIIFQSGILAGREFDLEQTDDALTGYIHKEDVDGVMVPARRFKIVPTEIDGYVMPGGVFVPAVGDKYAIFNISMPEAYISDDVSKTGASWDMFRDVVKVFAREEEDKFTFTGQMDGIWSRSRWLEIGAKIVPGGHILYSDDQFLPDGSVIRITGVKDYVNAPHKPEITLSNATSSVSLGSVIDDLEAEEVIREADKVEARRFARRQWRDAKETMRLLEASLLNFSGSINPIVVQTMQLLVGDQSLQFRFVNSKTAPQVVEHIVAFDPETDTFAAASGILQHMTIGINEIKKAHSAEDYKYWDMATYLSPPLDPEKSYYLYAKCDIAGPSGVFLLSETAIKMDAITGYHHLLVGILNSEYDGNRSFAQMYGFTEILPGRITTDKITSTDGLTYFDLVNGIIGGRIKFLSNGTETDLSLWADNILGELYETEQAVIDLGEYVDGAFMDGVIEESEAKAIEKYINQVNKEKSDLEATYNKLYLNPLLSGTPKTNLLNAKITLFGDIDSLISTINSVIADGKATPSEKIQVDNAFTAYKNSLAVFRTRIEEANQSVQQYLKSESDGARAAAAAAESAANAASQDVDDLSGIVNDLDAYVDGAFHDGVIEEAEAKAIDTYINQINTEKASLEATYNKLYLNSYLSGTPKTNLLNAKVTYFGSVDSLISSINGVIADGKVTPSEKQSIDAIFATYRTDKAALSTRIEEANKAIQDYLKSNADAIDAKVNLAKAVTDKFGTTVDGGLINTVMMLLRELNSLQETAGISGIQGALKNNPAFWAGGTYSQAFALIQFLSKMSAGTTPSSGEYNNLAKITLLHNGAAKVGDFIIEPSGRIVMVDPATGMARLVFGIENIPTVSSLMSGTVYSGSTDIGSGSTNTVVTLSGNTSVSQAGAVATFNGTTITIDANGKAQTGGFSSFATAELNAYRNGIKALTLAAVDVYFTGTSYQNSQSSAVVPSGTQYLPGTGTYTFKLEVIKEGDISSASATSTATNFAWSYTLQDVKRQQYGLNGMMFFYSNNHFHFTEGGGLDVRGTVNMPGVLLSGTVASGGGISYAWGAKQSASNPVNNSTGRYTVYHTVGHSNYQVFTTALTASKTCHIVSKSNTNFVVEWRSVGSTPALINTGFDFQIVGNNYV